MRRHDPYLAAICPWPTPMVQEAREHFVAVRREWFLRDLLKGDLT